jgi:hypothetical protein
MGLQPTDFDPWGKLGPTHQPLVPPKSGPRLLPGKRTILSVVTNRLFLSSLFLRGRRSVVGDQLSFTQGYRAAIWSTSFFHSASSSSPMERSSAESFRGSGTRRTTAVINPGKSWILVSIFPICWFGLISNPSRIHSLFHCRAAPRLSCCDPNSHPSQITQGCCGVKYCGPRSWGRQSRRLSHRRRRSRKCPRPRPSIRISRKTALPAPHALCFDRPALAKWWKASSAPAAGASSSICRTDPCQFFRCLSRNATASDHSSKAGCSRKLGR